MNSQVMKLWGAERGADDEPDSRILLVGAVEDDGDCVARFFDQFPWPIQRVRSCQEAQPLIGQHLTRVVVCERDLSDGNWKDVLEIATTREDPPVVIVTFRLADEHLWAEVLNLGGYDVLAKPLDPTEVHRTINLAWQHWASRRDMPGFRKTARQESEDYHVYQLGRTD
jgi:DNA-binding response OmpR family regulator